MSPIALNADDAAWFGAHPHRQFRCRHLTATERAEDRDKMPAAGLARLAYVRRSDGAMVKVWTPRPDILLNDEDEGRARWAAQAMPNPPPLNEPETRIDFDAVAAPVEASVRALAEDALARGVITAERRRAILAEPEACVLPDIGFTDDGTAGPRLKVEAKINPAFLVEVGLPERQS